MTGADAAAADVVDLIFELHGKTVAEDCADLLWQGVRAALPWLEDVSCAGVHPLAGTSPGQGERYLSRRARLTLRLPAEWVAPAQALTGARFDLGGAVEVGAAKVRELGAASVLYSPFVVVGAADEAAFVAECRRLLDGVGIAGQMVTGKARSLQTAGAVVRGFSLLVHGLREAESLRLQRVGLGSERKRGCGVFVRHKSVVAVGDA